MSYFIANNLNGHLEVFFKAIAFMVKSNRYQVRIQFAQIASRMMEHPLWSNATFRTYFIQEWQRELQSLQNDPVKNVQLFYEDTLKKKLGPSLLGSACSN